MTINQRGFYSLCIGCAWHRRRQLIALSTEVIVGDTDRLVNGQPPVHHARSLMRCHGGSRINNRAILQQLLLVAHHVTTQCRWRQINGVFALSQETQLNYTLLSLAYRQLYSCVMRSFTSVFVISQWRRQGAICPKKCGIVSRQTIPASTINLMTELLSSISRFGTKQAFNHTWQSSESFDNMHA